MITRLFENILFLFQHASFSNRVPLVCRVPLLQQGPVGVPLLLPFPTEYLWSAEYLCCSRVPLGYLCCFLFQQSTSGLQSTSVSAGSLQGYHCCFPHTHSHTLTHTLTRAHTPSRTRANTPTHTRSGSRDPKLGSRGSCLRLHRSGPGQARRLPQDGQGARTCGGAGKIPGILI